MTTVFPTQRLHNKTVLVTGASGGIGKAAAVLFARAGCNVVLTARRAEALSQAATECSLANQQGQTGAGGNFAAITLDMRDRTQLDGMLASLPDWAKNVDILVNNAGLVLGTDKVGDISPDEIDVMLDTNVRGLIHLTQIFVREFKKRNAGHIINLGSIAGREGYRWLDLLRHQVRGECFHECAAQGACRHPDPRDRDPARHGRDRL